MAIDLTAEIIKNKEVIFIEDNGCVVLPTGGVVGWFKEIVCHERFKNRMAFCLISKFRPNEEKLLSEHRSLTYNIPELKKTEVQSMFMKLLGIYGLNNLTVEDKRFFLEHLRGIPAQIIFAVKMIDINLMEAKKSIKEQI